MNRSAIEAARHFLAVVWGGEAPSEAALAEALDRLLWAYHPLAEASFAHSDIEAPREDWRILYERVAGRFPDFGLYPVTDPLAPIDGALMIGDAIDDIMDITLDMRSVVWLSEHAGIEDAHWYYQLLFFHWGRHARGLSHYLHARRFD